MNNRSRMSSKNSHQDIGRHFKDKDRVKYFAAPGRVNLIGEHTDYNGGLVLPMAIDRFIHLLIRKREDNEAIVYTNELKEVESFDLSKINGKKRGKWTDYIEGVLWELKKMSKPPRGFEACISSDIPMGGGLSSSAALEMVFAYGLNELFDLRISPLELIKLGQRAENEFVGANTGIMDQYISFCGRAGKALLLDTAVLKHEFIDLNLGENTILVIDTTVHHSHLSNQYNQRRQECEQALSIINGFSSNKTYKNLSELSPEVFEKFENKLPTKLTNRVCHVIEENQRVRETAEALKRGDIKSVGELFLKSHASLRDLYQVSAPELDFLIDFAVEKEIFGARITGGGFGGSTIHLLPQKLVEDYAQEATKLFYRRFQVVPRIFAPNSSNGVSAFPD